MGKYFNLKQDYDYLISHLLTQLMNGDKRVLQWVQKRNAPGIKKPK
jgi:hypothetical protein